MLTPDSSSSAETASALRQISRGLAALADAISPVPGDAPEDRYQSVMTEWGARGLTRKEASQLFRKHGFSPQTAGGWVRGDWLTTREDGLRYLTPRSQSWLDARRTDEGAATPARQRGAGASGRR